jgi:hypothetical protein
MKNVAIAVMAILISSRCGSTLRAEGDAADDTAPELTVDIAPELAVDPLPEPTIDPGPVDTGVDTAPGTGATGDACIEDSDCAAVPGAGRFCLDRIEFYGGYGIDFPAGYCSADCGDPSDCGPGADCVDFGGPAMCFKRCATTDECRASEGYVCYEIPYVTTQTYCVPYV